MWVGIRSWYGAFMDGMCLLKRLQRVFHRGKTQWKAPPIRQIAAFTRQTL